MVYNENTVDTESFTALLNLPNNKESGCIMKKVCIIDGRDNPDVDFATEISQLLIPKENKTDYDYFTLKDMNINYCIGCWDCWVKTPGICRLKDDHALVLKSLINSQHVLFISNVRTGFVTSTLKKTLDRIIPTALPYIKEYKNESHHYQRYENSAKFHVLLLEDILTTKNEVNLIEDYFNRLSLNFYTDVISFTTYNKKGDLANVISNM